jgi:hypothetical protein
MCSASETKKEFAVAGIVPELKTVPISETLDAPLVTVWGAKIIVKPCYSGIRRNSNCRRYNNYGNIK